MAPNSSTPAPSGAVSTSSDASEVSRVNSANGLTLMRLLLVPVFVALLFADGGANVSWRFAAFAVFVLAAVSDRVDGEVARRRGLVTDFGKVADPIADKALIGAALVSLSVLGELAYWMTAAILAREIAVTLLRLTVIKHHIIPASPGGKVKTVLQVVAIMAYLLPAGAVPFGEFLVTARMWVMVAALVVTVGTGIDYVVRASRLRRSAAYVDVGA